LVTPTDPGTQIIIYQSLTHEALAQLKAKGAASWEKATASAGSALAELKAAFEHAKAQME